MTPARHRRLLASLKLEEVKTPPEHVALFERRTRGFWQTAWSANNHSFEATRKALKVYGLSCYMQGVMDGVNTASMRPELVEWLASRRTSSTEAPAPR